MEIWNFTGFFAWMAGCEVILTVDNLTGKVMMESAVHVCECGIVSNTYCWIAQF